MTVEDVPRHVQARFFGLEDHEQDRWTQNEKLQEACLAFYGDGSTLPDIYSQGIETYDQAAAKFLASDSLANMKGKGSMTMSYNEARQCAYNK